MIYHSPRVCNKTQHHNFKDVIQSFLHHYLKAIHRNILNTERRIHGIGIL
jgi:hypothetical protein